MSKPLAEVWFEAFRDKDIDKLQHTLAQDFVHTSPFGEMKGNSMQYEVSIPENAKYAIIRVTEEIDPSLAQKILEEIVKIQKESALHQFLLDVREV